MLFSFASIGKSQTDLTSPSTGHATIVIDSLSDKLANHSLDYIYDGNNMDMHNSDAVPLSGMDFSKKSAIPTPVCSESLRDFKAVVPALRDTLPGDNTPEEIAKIQAALDLIATTEIGRKLCAELGDGGCNRDVLQKNGIYIYIKPNMVDPTALASTVPMWGKKFLFFDNYEGAAISAVPAAASFSTAFLAERYAHELEHAAQYKKFNDVAKLEGTGKNMHMEDKNTTADERGAFTFQYLFHNELRAKGVPFAPTTPVSEALIFEVKVGDMEYDFWKAKVEYQDKTALPDINRYLNGISDPMNQDKIKKFYQYFTTAYDTAVTSADLMKLITANIVAINYSNEPKTSQNQDFQNYVDTRCAEQDSMIKYELYMSGGGSPNGQVAMFAVKLELTAEAICADQKSIPQYTVDVFVDSFKGLIPTAKFVDVGYRFPETSCPYNLIHHMYTDQIDPDTGLGNRYWNADWYQANMTYYITHNFRDPFVSPTPAPSNTPGGTSQPEHNNGDNTDHDAGHNCFPGEGGVPGGCLS